MLLAAMLCLPQWMMAQKADPVFGLQEDPDNPVLNVITVGETCDASPVLYNHQNLPVTWSSSNEEYFTVNQNGIITPLKSNSGDVPVYVYLRVHTDGNEYYNEADGEIEIWIYDALTFLPYTTAEVVVTQTNASDILGNGKLSYNFATHTLTMNSWTVDCPTDFSISKDDINWLFKYINRVPLTVNLVGTNTISNGKDLFDAEALTFSGSGSLTVNDDQYVLSVRRQLTIDGASLTLNMATDNLDPYQRYTNYGVFWTDSLFVINSGYLHATVSTNVDLSSCGSCYTVGQIGYKLVGNILTPHVIWSNDPEHETSINEYFSTNYADFIGCFFDDQGGAMLPREVEISGAAPVDTRADLELYFQEWDYDLWQDKRITEKEVAYDSWGYSEASQIDFKCAEGEEALLPSITFTSSDEDILQFNSELDPTYADRYMLYLNPQSLGTATITATFAGNEQYKPATATLTVTMVDGKYYFAPDLVYKEKSDPSSYRYDVLVEHITMTEGDQVMLPVLCHQNSSYEAYHIEKTGETARSHFFFPWRDPECTTAGCSVYGDRIKAVAAGEDTLITQYRYYDDEPWQTIKLPITINPLVAPIPANTGEVTYDFSSVDPDGESTLIFSGTASDTYNSSTGQLEISTPLSPAVVEQVMTENAAGTDDWKTALPGSLTLNLPAGKGKIYIECQTTTGFELKVKIRGQVAITISQTTMGLAQVDYDVIEPTALVIYLAASSSSPAPKRAPAAKMDGAKALIKSLSLVANYEATAKEDPENAGVYYSTFFDSAKKYELPTGTEAYVADISGTDLLLNKIADGGQVIPENTAVILKATSASVSLAPSDAAAVTVSATNQLQGVDDATAAPANCYVLSGHSSDNLTTGVGFYQFTGTLAAHKAYIIYSSAAPAPKRMRFIFDTATDIDNTNAALKSEKRFENGQLIIIRNGVKYNAAGQTIK